jgi:GNAT superfamily N-acetyltransferase
MIVVDKQLSQRLERTEARVNADFVETRQRLSPEYGAAWIEVGGAYAMFDGTESPLTQTFGLGIFEDVTPEHLDEIEAFFAKHDAPVFHEISPLADPSHMELLASRGYRPVELTSVMFRELTTGVATRERNAELQTRVITPDEVELWARTSAEAWKTEHPSLGDFMFNFGSISAQCKGAFPYIAELAGTAIATGMLFIVEDICMLAGASTLPDGRRRGAQTALLEDRLSFAATRGCQLAIMGASPGSQSQTNAQKNGFHIAYTRTKWQLIKE